MDEKEFRQRVMPLKRLMYGVALKMGIPPDDAADAVQETQINLWRCRDRIPDDDAGMRFYCMAAFRNECISQLRRKRPTVDLDDVAEPSSDEPDRVALRDLMHRVDEVIETLPAGQREALRLSSYGGLETAEIAERTGQSEGNVRQLLSRARRTLRAFRI